MFRYLAKEHLIMNGVPAGIEYDSFDDEDDYDNGFCEPSLSSYVQPENKSSLNSNSVFGKNNGFNVKDLEEQVSLHCTDMKTAVLKGNLQYVQDALSKGFNTETLMESGWTLLMYAANNACNDIVQLLLEHKASPNFQKDLFTPLMAACFSSVKNEEKLVTCAELLINAGAKVNVHDRHVMTPLMYASKLGYGKLVTLLCDKNAQLNVQDTQGWTALTFAAASGYSHVIKILLKYQADYNLTTFDGQKPADIAFSHGNAMLAEMLEKYDGDDLDQFQSITKGTASENNSAFSAKYVKYGDLELFLYGLELGQLIPLMKEHHLQFEDLIKLTENEMIEIGITQLGIRKKLLDSISDVHTNEWDLSSLSKDQITKMSTIETSAIVANITRHLQIINCSVKYVINHINNKKEDMVSDNLVLQKSLVDQCFAAVKVSKDLQKDVLSLRNEAVLLFPNTEKKPVHLIEESSTKETSKQSKRLLIPVGVVLLSSCLFFSYRVLTR